MDWRRWVAEAAAPCDPAWHPLVTRHLDDLAAGLATATESTLPQGAVFAHFARPPSEIRGLVLGATPRPTADELRALPCAAGSDLSAPDVLANWSVQGILYVGLSLTAGDAPHDFWEHFVHDVIGTTAAASRDCIFVFMPSGRPALARAVAPHAARGHRVWVPSQGLACLTELPWDLRIRVPKLELYTDGSRPGTNSRGAPGQAGAAWVMLAGPGAACFEQPDAPAPATHSSVPCAELPVPGAQTNQRAELEAMRQALCLAARTHWDTATIFTDSKYAKYLALGEWTAKTNLRLAAATRQAFLAAAARGPINIVHIRGHGRALGATPRQRCGNDLADCAANRAARKKFDHSLDLS